MQKRVLGLLCLYLVLCLSKEKARWPMNLLPMRYIICRMRKAIGLSINLYFNNKRCRPSQAGLLPHGRCLSIFFATNRIRHRIEMMPVQNMIRSNQLLWRGTSLMTSYGTGIESRFD